MKPITAPKHGRGELAFLAVLTIVLVVLEGWPVIDFSISRLFYDPSLRSFPLAHDPIWEEVLHRGVRKSMQLVQLGSLLAWFLSLVWTPLKPWRRCFAYFLVASLSAAVLVGGLKELTARACPAQLIDFGGAVAFQPLWSGVAEMPGNRCWPGGHVLHAFTLLPLYFVLQRRGLKRIGAWALSVILAFGMILNVTQIARGAHFLSHNLWSLWWCWSISLVVDRLWRWQSQSERSPALVPTTLVNSN